MSDPKAFNCPSCGAPLSIKGSEREVVCQYCGTHVVVPEEMRAKPAAPVAPQITVQPKVVVVSPYAVPASGYRARRSGCSGIAITFSIIIAVVGFTLTKNPLLQKQLLGALTSGNNVLTSVGVNPGAVVSGSEGTDPGQFELIRHFAIDPAGNFYVADMKTFRIQKFDANGKYILNWNVDQGKAEYGPDSMAADSAGNIYAVEDGVILKYDGATTKLLGKFTGQGDHFYDIAVTQQGSLWAVSSNAFDTQLVHLDSQGKVLDRVANAISSQIDSSGFAAWEVYLALDKTGNIFALVSDSFHPKVLEFSPDARKVLAIFGDGGDTPGKFSHPYDIAVDDLDHVYVSEQSRVQVLDNQGRYLKNLIESRSLAATALKYDGKGSIYAVGYNAIFRYSVG